MNIHVYPIDDIEPHTVDGSYCPCGIVVEEFRTNHLIIHTAFDGRDKPCAAGLTDTAVVIEQDTEIE